MMVPLDRVFREVDESREEILDLAKSLVGLDTSNTGTPDSGNETRVTAFLAKRLSREGIPRIRLLGRVPSRKNLVVSLPGRNRGCALLFLSHCDVVPSGAVTAWATLPFSPTVRGGRLYGRGAADMKGTLAAQVIALVVARRLGLRLDAGVRLLCVADEEAGGRFGAGWLRKRYPHLLRADLALNEGGGHCYLVNGRLVYGVARGEKGRYEAIVLFRGAGAHASTPWRGINAITRAAEFVQRVTSRPPTASPNAVLVRPFRVIASDLVMNPSGFDEFLDSLASRNEPLATELRALTRTTITPTMIAGGVKSNSVPDECRVVCDVRTLPSVRAPDVRRHLERQAKGLSADVELSITAAPSVSIVPTKFMRVIREALCVSSGRQVELLSTMTLGFTDSRFAREVGTLALGCAPDGIVGEGAEARMHGPNESIGLESLYLRARFYAAVIALAAGEG